MSRPSPSLAAHLLREIDQEDEFYIWIDADCKRVKQLMHFGIQQESILNRPQSCGADQVIRPGVGYPIPVIVLSPDRFQRYWEDVCCVQAGKVLS